MKRFKNLIAWVALFLLVTVSTASAAGLPSLIKKINGTELVPVNPLFTLGGVGNEWVEGHFIDLFTTNIAVGGGLTGAVDLNGNELIIDVDGDTKLSAAVDDVISIVVGGAEKVVIDSTGLLVDMISNTADANNAQIVLPTSGVFIIRNQADGNPALTVSQSNAGSTGVIMSYVNAAGGSGVFANGANLEISASTLTVAAPLDNIYKGTRTLNDTSADGGTQEFSAIDIFITATDVTGWDTLNLMNLGTDSGDRFTVDLLGGVVFNPAVGSKLAMNIAGVTNTDGLFDMDFTTGAGGANGINVSATITSDVNGVGAIAGKAVGLSSGGASGNTQFVFVGDLIGNASDSDHSYVLLDGVANDNGGSGNFIGLNLDANFRTALRFQSGDVEFLGYDAQFARIDNTSIPAGDEAIAIRFGDGGGTRTWVGGGTQTNQREFAFLGQQYECTSSCTFTNVANLYFNTPPSAGANATFTLPANNIWVDSGPVRFDGRILEGKGSDVASGDEITLGDANYFDITGTTTINHINNTGWTAGTEICLQFDASVTFTHNAGTPTGTEASMLLASASDFSATVDDTWCGRYDGVFFRETSRTAI